MRKKSDVKIKPIMVQESIPVDMSELLNSVPKAIAYLQAQLAVLPPDAIMSDQTPYPCETVEFAFVYEREETASEAYDRWQKEVAAKRLADMRAKDIVEKQERRRLWERLNREFGR